MNLKIEAARAALAEVRSGMTLGLGTGSTAYEFVALLGEALRSGTLRDIRCTSTSVKTEEQARSENIPMFALAEIAPLDLAVDGADEIDARLRLIKGRGGALLREKIVASASREMIVIADETKFVARLGRFPLPIEVVDFGLGATERAIGRVLTAENCAGALQLRRKKDGHVFVTDQGHFILDAVLGAIPDARSLARGLAEIPGVVEHGLFVGLARRAILAGSSGVRIVERS